MPILDALLEPDQRETFLRPYMLDGTIEWSFWLPMFPDTETFMRVSPDDSEELQTALRKLALGDPQPFDLKLCRLLTDRHRSAPELFEFGSLLLAWGWPSYALKLYHRSLSLDSTSFEAWFAAGLCHHHLGQLPQALSSYEAALMLGKGRDIASVHSNLSAACIALKKNEAAEVHARHSVTLNPAMGEAYYNLALSLESWPSPPKTLNFYGRAIQINPSFAQARTNRGKLHQESGKFDFALVDHRNALVFNPGLEEAIHNRATVLSELRDFETSIREFGRALAIRPNFPNAHLGMSMTLLMVGNYLEGWAENEWRFLEHLQHGVRAMSRSPRLTPEKLSEIKGKKVLLFWEQGLGDTLHFCRYAKCLADLGAVVVLNVQRELLPIMPSLDARIEITDSSSDRVDCDFHAYLMSLAHIFGTEVKTIPAEVPYLSVSPESVSRWGQRLKEAGRPRVGLVISGAASFKNDHNRSIPLSLMAPLLELPLDFHCLQKELRVDDSRVAKRHTNFYQYTNEIETFEDTAALVASMDLVICVDTSVAHLVGAMAKPLWLLVPYTPDNRWFLDRTDSPWYPTAAIYRQNERNNWPAVIGRVRADLIQRFVPHLA